MGKLLKFYNEASGKGLRYPMRRVFDEADKIWTIHGQDLGLTCGCEGEHSPRSYHYYGYAVDLKTAYFGTSQARIVHSLLKESLPEFYDVVLHEESHIHVEFDVERFKAKFFDILSVAFDAFI